MFRTITAKYPGICKRCNKSIFVGDKIRYGGPGRTYHMAANCDASTTATSSRTGDAIDGFNLDDMIEQQAEQDQRDRDGE